MAVRTKFWVSEKRPVERSNGEEAVTVALLAVYEGSPENKEYWRLTPSGSINLFTVNAAAAAQFEVGKQYYVTFERADGEAD